ncbi:hypothetical protein HYALB_00011104 [Hymenoscyphus albidus]|uniref:U3 small nucleolar RNA-associated protein 11 n=1 Tax=Hymenoscyphus albidus TaxID=595503 RepID=A0A9N9Q8Z2_9HELO|nr:hypothetical protein HYALB_00011104 [Hymenoscyphus albidus]
MSSMRNAIQRRNHRERGQPEERKKLGLLEKHKDYSLRAADHNLKKRKLKALKQKVLEKNPDEFYFGMLSRKGPATMGKNRTGTVSGDRGNEAMSVETVRLLKTQDVGYVRTARNTAAKEVKAIEEKIALMDATSRDEMDMDDEDEEDEERFTPRGKKTVFVDGGEEMELRIQEAEMEIEAAEDRDETLSPEEKALRKLQRREREKLEHRLKVAKERLDTLTQTEQALELQRAGMAKTATIGGINKFGVKFKVKDRKR